MVAKLMNKQVVSFHYTLKDKNGQVLDSSANSHPLSYLSGTGQIIPGLEEELNQLKTGDKKQVVVPAAKAYGEHSEKMVIKIARSRLPEAKMQVGDRFRASEDPHSPVFTVTEITATDVTLDGNHPLAGQDLYFDVEVTDMREATAEELEHGHSHHECCGRHDKCEH